MFSPRRMSRSTGVVDFTTYGTCIAWFDGQDSSTLWNDLARSTPATLGDVVRAWDDKSGNASHAALDQTTATVINTDMNGNQSVYSGGSMTTGAFTTGTATTVTIFSVINVTNSGIPNQSPFDGDAAANRVALAWDNGVTRFRALPDYQPGSGTVTTGTPIVIATVIRAVASGIYVDNVLLGNTWNPSSYTLSGLTIGSLYTGGGGFFGPIGEIIVYNNDFTLGDREEISDLLTDKWASLWLIFPTVLSILER